MILSILFNYFCGRDIQANGEDAGKAKLSLAFAVTVNILILGFFKYYGFILDTVNSLLPSDILTGSFPFRLVSHFIHSRRYPILWIFTGRRQSRRKISYILRYISACSHSSSRVRSSAMWILKLSSGTERSLSDGWGRGRCFLSSALLRRWSSPTQQALCLTRYPVYLPAVCLCSRHGLEFFLMRSRFI